MKKRIVSFLVMATLVFSFTGCSSVKTEKEKSESTDNFSQYKAELQEGVDNLNNSDANYLISNILEAPEGTSYYLESFFTTGESFTEYPISSEGELGKMDNTSEDKPLTYRLTDWITTDGKMYINNSQSTENEDFYSLPDSYANICKSRNVMFVDTMLNDFVEITKEEDKQEVDLGEKDEVSITMYKCVLPSEKVKNYLAVGSLALYNSLKNDVNSSENIKKLCDYYLDDLNATMYFSDANVYLGIDANKTLRTYSLEVGGLGSRLYLTKTVLYGDFKDVKQPNFENAKPYSESIEDLANYLADTDGDYSKAINQLYEYGEEVKELEDESSSDD